MILIYIDRGRLPPREVKLRAALSSQVVRRQGKLVAKVDPLLEEIDMSGYQAGYSRRSELGGLV